MASEGARGGKAKGWRSSEAHKARVKFEKTTAVHVPLRVVEKLEQLRKAKAYHAIRKAMEVVLEKQDFRIVHVSLERGHMHLIVEAENHEALAKGMQSFRSLQHGS